MAKNLYRTAQGQIIDIDHLRLTNEKAKAVGNMQVNARGDQISSDGTILKTKQQQLKERNKSIKNMVTYKSKRKG
jgi:hypothetical protein